MLSPKPLHVFPVRVAPVPVDPPAVDSHWFALWLKYEGTALLLGCYGSRQGKLFAAITHYQEVTRAAFNNLTLNRMHPGAIIATILAGRMDKHSVITSLRGPLAHRFATPLILNYQFVVLVFFVRRYAAPLFAGDADDSIVYGKYLLGIVVAAPIL